MEGRFHIAKFLHMENQLSTAMKDIDKLIKISCEHGNDLKDVYTRVSGAVSKAELYAAMSTIKPQHLQGTQNENILTLQQKLEESEAKRVVQEQIATSKIKKLENEVAEIKKLLSDLKINIDLQPKINSEIMSKRIIRKNSLSGSESPTLMSKFSAIRKSSIKSLQPNEGGPQLSSNNNKNSNNDGNNDDNSSSNNNDNNKDSRQNVFKEDAFNSVESFSYYNRSNMNPPPSSSSSSYYTESKLSEEQIALLENSLDYASSNQPTNSLAFETESREEKNKYCKGSFSSHVTENVGHLASMQNSHQHNMMQQPVAVARNDSQQAGIQYMGKLYTKRIINIANPSLSVEEKESCSQVKAASSTLKASSSEGESLDVIEIDASNEGINDQRNDDTYLHEILTTMMRTIDHKIAAVETAMNANSHRVDTSVERVETVFQALKLLDNEHTALLNSHRTIIKRFETMESAVYSLVNRILSIVDNSQIDIERIEEKLVNLSKHTGRDEVSVQNEKSQKQQSLFGFNLKAFTEKVDIENILEIDPETKSNKLNSKNNQNEFYGLMTAKGQANLFKTMEYMMSQIKGFHSAYQRMVSEYKSLGAKLTSKSFTNNNRSNNQNILPSSAPNNIEGKRPASQTRSQINSAPSMKKQKDVNNIRKDSHNNNLKYFGFSQDTIPNLNLTKNEDGTLFNFAGESEKLGDEIIAHFSGKLNDRSEFVNNYNYCDKSDIENKATSSEIVSNSISYRGSVNDSLDLDLHQHSKLTCTSAPHNIGREQHTNEIIMDRPITRSEISRLLVGKDSKNRNEIQLLKQEIAKLKNSYGSATGNQAIPPGIVFDFKDIETSSSELGVPSCRNYEHTSSAPRKSANNNRHNRAINIRENALDLHIDASSIVLPPFTQLQIHPNAECDLNLRLLQDDDQRFVSPAISKQHENSVNITKHSVIAPSNDIRVASRQSSRGLAHKSHRINRELGIDDNSMNNCISITPLLNNVVHAPPKNDNSTVNTHSHHDSATGKDSWFRSYVSIEIPTPKELEPDAGFTNSNYERIYGEKQFDELDELDRLESVNERVIHGQNSDVSTVSSLSNRSFLLNEQKSFNMIDVPTNNLSDDLGNLNIKPKPFYNGINDSIIDDSSTGK